MAVVKIVPFPGAPGPRGYIGPQGSPGAAGPAGADGVADATAPLTYNDQSHTVGIDQSGFDHIGNLVYADFDIDGTTPGPQSGRIMWDSYHETLKLGVGVSASLNLGQELQMSVQNLSGENIPVGTLVMCELDNSGNIRTINGGMFRVVRAITNGTYGAKIVLGVAVEDIANGTKGMITTTGHVHGVNTSSYQVGQILWANPSVPGGFTTVAPSAPNLKLPVATVTTVGDSTIGSLYVRMTQGSTLGETDHNVQITNPQDGDVLKYNGTTHIWYNAQP